jgi:formate dehydrogenase subunit delta
MDRMSVVRLANDIAAQFAHEPAPVAARSVANHIRTFWDPRMRAGLLALDGAGEQGLAGPARDAVGLLRRPG